jgi:hypothetical protein
MAAELAGGAFAGVPPGGAVAWAALARALVTLDEFVTRE